MGPGIMYGGGEDGDAAGCGKSKNKSNRCGILEAVAVVVFAFDIFTSDSVGKSMYNRSDFFRRKTDDDSTREILSRHNSVCVGFSKYQDPGCVSIAILSLHEVCSTQYFQTC